MASALDKYLETESFGIVLLGNFNPSIVQPFWLSNKELIREEEAESASIDVIHNDLSRFSLQDWLEIEFQEERSYFICKASPYFQLTADLVIEIFRILAETPFKSVGLNFSYELKLKSAEEFLEFGKKLSALDLWSESLDNPKLLQIDVMQAERTDDLKGHKRIRVSSSELIQDYGVNILFNDHFKIKTSPDLISIMKSWEDAYHKSKLSINNFLGKMDLKK